MIRNPDGPSWVGYRVAFLYINTVIMISTVCLICYKKSPPGTSKKKKKALLTCSSLNSTTHWFGCYNLSMSLIIV